MKTILFILCLALAGCATHQQVIPPGTPSLWLAEPCERTAIAFGPDASVILPAGEYRPIYRDTHGTYYAPAAAIIAFGNQAMEKWRLYITDNGSQKIEFGGAGRPGVLDRPVPLTTKRPPAKPGVTPSR